MSQLNQGDIITDMARYSPTAQSRAYIGVSAQGGVIAAENA